VLVLNIGLVPAWLCNVNEWQKVSRKGEIPRVAISDDLDALLYVVGNASTHAQVALKSARRAASESCMFKESAVEGLGVGLIVFQDIKTEVLFNVNGTRVCGKAGTGAATFVIRL
jgi:hypothetical protein